MNLNLGCVKTADRAATEKIVFKVVGEMLGFERDEMSLDSNFQDDLSADSLDLIELVMALEEQLGIAIPDDDVARLETIKHVINYLESRRIAS